MEKLRKELFSRIKELGIDGLVSISLVGSFQDVVRLNSVNDVDLLVLVRELTPEVFRQMNSEFKKISRDFTTDKIQFFVENRAGPLKPKPIKGKKVVQLHLIMFDLSLFDQFMGQPNLFDWTNFNTNIVGKPLKKSRKINKKVVIKEYEKRLYSIKNKCGVSRVFKKENGKIIMEEKNIKLKDSSDMIIFSIITSAMNYLRLKLKKKMPKSEILKESKKILPKETFQILKRTFHLKNELRLKNKLSVKEKDFLKLSGTIFIEYLIKELKTNK